MILFQKIYVLIIFHEQHSLSILDNNITNKQNLDKEINLKDDTDLEKKKDLSTILKNIFYSSLSKNLSNSKSSDKRFISNKKIQKK